MSSSVGINFCLLHGHDGRANFFRFGLIVNGQALVAGFHFLSMHKRQLSPNFDIRRYRYDVTGVKGEELQAAEIRAALTKLPLDHCNWKMEKCWRYNRAIFHRRRSDSIASPFTRAQSQHGSGDDISIISKRFLKFLSLLPMPARDWRSFSSVTGRTLF
jgi:hypothetical protein